MSSRQRSKDTLGVALSPGAVTAASAASATVWQRAIELNGGANGAVELLRDALATAARESGLGSPAIAVALMPPLSETRTIPLPPLAEDDRNQFLTRNASRYFVAARGAQVVGSTSAVAATGGNTPPVLAAATSQQLMQAMQGAATAAELTLATVVPAESAWAAAATTIWPTLARGTAHVIVARNERGDLLTLHEGRLRAVRRFRGAVDAREIVAEAGGAGAARIAVLGTAEAAQALAAALSVAGAIVVRPDARWAALSEHPEALAARFAGAAVGLEIRTEESRIRERDDARRLAWWIGGAAAVTLLLAAFTHYRGVQRELQAVQAERAAIRPQVEATLVGRSSVDAAVRQVAALAAASREAPRWSIILAALTRTLPGDASLSAFRARGDSIFVDGVADHAMPVFDEIARTPGIVGVRASAPVRREAIEGEAPLEHFAVGAQVAVPARVPTGVQPAPTGARR